MEKSVPMAAMWSTVSDALPATTSPPRMWTWLGAGSLSGTGSMVSTKVEMASRLGTSVGK